MSTLSSAPLIFVSHKTCDADIARELQSALDQEFLGLPRFFNASDQESLQPGTAWFDSIVEALRSCAVLLAILSPTALASPWVNFESGAAWLQDTLLIPCCIGQVRKSSLPAPYGNLQAVELDDPDDLDQLFRRLASKAGLRFTSHDRTPLAKKLAELWQVSAASQQDESPGDFGSRVEEHMQIDWVYGESQTVEECWAAKYTHKAAIRVIAEQIESVTIELSPTIEAVTFAGVNAPQTALREYTRSSPGQARLAPPHASSGHFAFRIHFDPPLRRGDTATYVAEIDFPAYKLAVRERLVQELLESDAKMRDYEFAGRKLTRPCEQSTYRVSIPKRLRATPLQPEVLLDGQPFEDEQQYVLREPGVFKVFEEEANGEPHWMAQIDRIHPPHHATYRLRWRLPRRRELQTPMVP